jgi:hypothetical protein
MLYSAGLRLRITFEPKQILPGKLGAQGRWDLGTKEDQCHDNGHGERPPMQLIAGAPLTRPAGPDHA